MKSLGPQIYFGKTHLAMLCPMYCELKCNQSLMLQCNANKLLSWIDKTSCPSVTKQVFGPCRLIIIVCMQGTAMLSCFKKVTMCTWFQFSSFVLTFYPWEEAVCKLENNVGLPESHFETLDSTRDKIWGDSFVAAYQIANRLGCYKFLYFFGVFLDTQVSLAPTNVSP